jgi:hypothetical protein
MKRSIILFFLLVVLAILAYGRVSVPGATTQSEQRRIKGMSVMVEDL